MRPPGFNIYIGIFLSLTEIKKEQKKEGDTFLGPSGDLKLCSSETAEKIRKENSSEVLCPESGIEQAEEY